MVDYNILRNLTTANCVLEFCVPPCAWQLLFGWYQGRWMKQLRDNIMWTVAEETVGLPFFTLCVCVYVKNCASCKSVCNYSKWGEPHTQQQQPFTNVRSSDSHEKSRERERERERKRLWNVKLMSLVILDNARQAFTSFSPLFTQRRGDRENGRGSARDREAR